jgi:hypothetical protein
MSEQHFCEMCGFSSVPTKTHIVTLSTGFAATAKVHDECFEAFAARCEVQLEQDRRLNDLVRKLLNFRLNTPQRFELITKNKQKQDALSKYLEKRAELSKY